MGDDQKQELRRDLKHFWYKCIQIPKFKYWKWIILIICVSGIYSFYFIQNHTFALNSYQDTVNQFQHLKKSNKNQAKALQYAFIFPKYGKFQDNDHLIVKQPLRNIQTIRNLHTYTRLPQINELPNNRMIVHKYYWHASGDDLTDTDTDTDDEDEALSNSYRQDKYGNYLVPQFNNYPRSYFFVNLAPLKQNFVYNDLINQVRTKYAKDPASLTNIKTDKVSKSLVNLTYTVNLDKRGAVYVHELIDLNKHCVRAAVFKDNKTKEIFTQKYLFDNIKFPTYTLYANNQNLSNRYVNNLYKHFHKQTQTD